MAAIVQAFLKFYVRIVFNWLCTHEANQQKKGNDILQFSGILLVIPSLALSIAITWFLSWTIFGHFRGFWIFWTYIVLFCLLAIKWYDRNVPNVSSSTPSIKTKYIKCFNRTFKVLFVMILGDPHPIVNFWYVLAIRLRDHLAGGNFRPRPQTLLHKAIWICVLCLFLSTIVYGISSLITIPIATSTGPEVDAIMTSTSSSEHPISQSTTCQQTSPSSNTQSTTASSTGCVYPNFKDDGSCDDVNNNANCEYDGGDCCGDNVDTKYCTQCQCLDPAFSTTTPQSTMGTSTTQSTTTAPSACDYPDWQDDGFCDDENNNSNCEYDGGDCCGDNVDTSWCTQCLCLDPAYSTTSISTATSTTTP